MTDKLEYEQAAELRTETLWACKVCGRAWNPATFDGAERAARGCHAKDHPCINEGGRSRTPNARRESGRGSDAGEDERWAKKLSEAELWDGESPVYSDRLQRYYFHESWEDDIGDEEGQAPSLEALRLESCTPDNGGTWSSSGRLSSRKSRRSNGGDPWVLRSPEARAVEKVVNDWITAHAPFCWHSSGSAVIVPGMAGWVPVAERVKAGS